MHPFHRLAAVTATVMISASPAAQAQPIAVAPGQTAEVRCTPTEPGTFVYFGRMLGPGESASTPTPFPVRSSDRSLWGG
ncbi:MAG: hypothetical protein ACRELT_15945 [Longimicrobiales bacterium]